jgi:alkylhydroperoxidase family enzyme
LQSFAYKDLYRLSKAIQDATQQLAMLNMVNVQQKQAIATLVDLQKAGFSEKKIAELIGLINMWNKSG